jgi:hypothetical protein
VRQKERRREKQKQEAQTRANKKGLPVRQALDVFRR